MMIQRRPGTCHDCVHLSTFKARDDERERYGFGETGYGCKDPSDGGVYVLDPAKPTCLRGPVPKQAARATGAA